ncbi:MAG: hypothetical protein RMI91_11015 [Gemmatales bacterium]|nr:hypothetical protein [Gemmatales bacterium]MDW7995173.1 hypothetical protein [Gemmatales bacterium]
MNQLVGIGKMGLIFLAGMVVGAWGANSLPSTDAQERHRQWEIIKGPVERWELKYARPESAPLSPNVKRFLTDKLHEFNSLELIFMFDSWFENWKLRQPEALNRPERKRKSLGEALRLAQEAIPGCPPGQHAQPLDATVGDGIHYYYIQDIFLAGGDMPGFASVFDPIVSVRLSLSGASYKAHSQIWVNAENGKVLVLYAPKTILYRIREDVPVLFKSSP